MAASTITQSAITRSATNWKIVVLLSLLGVAIGITIKFGVTDRLYLCLLLWIAFPLLCAVFVAINAGGHFFRHGFFSGVLGGVWAALIPALSIKFGFSNTDSMANGLFIAGLLAAIIIVPGILAGALSIIAARLLKKSQIK